MIDQDVINEIKKDSRESLNDLVITAGEGILISGHGKDWFVKSDAAYIANKVLTISNKYTLTICVNGVPMNLDVLVGPGTQPYPI